LYFNSRCILLIASFSASSRSTLPSDGEGDAADAVLCDECVIRVEALEVGLDMEEASDLLGGCVIVDADAEAE